MTYELRPALWEDNAFLEKLYADVHGPKFASLGLSADYLAQMLALRFKAEHMDFATRFPDADHSIIHVENTAIGRVLIDETPAAIRLVDMALLSPLRGAGVGTSILEQLQTYAAEHGLPLRLAVHPQNPAIRLFHRLGFVTIGTETHGTEMEWNTPPLIPNEK